MTNGAIDDISLHLGNITTNFLYSSAKYPAASEEENVWDEANRPSLHYEVDR